MGHEVLKYIGNCLLVRSRVLDGDKPIRTLHCGLSYGHDLNFLKNKALWPLELYAVSSVTDTQQLRYVRTLRPKEWAVTARISPNRGQAFIEVLECREKKSGSDAICTQVVLNNNLFDELTLDLEVEH